MFDFIFAKSYIDLKYGSRQYLEDSYYDLKKKMEDIITYMNLQLEMKQL